MSELPKYVNCRNFINSKLEEKIGDEIRFIEGRTIAVFSNIDKYAELYESLTNESLGAVSMQKNGEDNLVFFLTVPATDVYTIRSRWGFQLKENKEEFLKKYKKDLDLFASII